MATPHTACGFLLEQGSILNAFTVQCKEAEAMLTPAEEDEKAKNVKNR